MEPTLSLTVIGCKMKRGNLVEKVLRDMRGFGSRKAGRNLSPNHATAELELER